MSSIAEKPHLYVQNQLVPLGAIESGAAPLVRQFENITTALEILGDLLAAALGIIGAYAIYHFLRLGKTLDYSVAMVVSAAFAFATLYVIMLDRDGAYRQGNGLLRIRETERALRVSVQSFLLIFPATFVAAHWMSRWVVGIAFVLVPIIVVTQKGIFFLFVRFLHSRGYGVGKVLIYGAGFTGKRVFSALVRSPKLGLDPVAVVDDDDQKVGREMYALGYRRERSANIISGPITPELIRSCGADMVLVAIPTLRRDLFRNVVEATVAAQAKLAYVPSQAISSESWVDYADVDGLMLATCGVPRSKAVYNLSKRAFDLCVSLAIVIAISPLLAAIALAVRLDSKGSIIFKQKRVGFCGQLFDIYKFRSMRVDAPKYGFSPKESEDPRITRVGRLLRKTSLDELPQLFNVLKGDMSLVGPRPEMPFIVEKYGPRELQRLKVVPGITGLWQLSADRAFLIHENIQYDLYYIRNCGFFMDMAILLHTVIFAMKGV